ncbi:hypothetical protein V8F20_004527 [Naviculisporaceae sp. PSN 640]
MDTTEVACPPQDEAVSPRQSAPPIEEAVQSLRTMNNQLNPLDMRADPDAQATVTDFLDFTEYLPSDMMRSLTLIGDLDQNYVDASTSLDELTSQWGELPTMAPDSRPRPVELRAQISEKLHRTVSSRVYAHAEAIRMSENLNRHYSRIKVILSKLETMLENYTEAEVKSPVATAKSPQAQKMSMRVDSQRVRRPRIPRITIPGEVLAPYELNYDAYTSEESSSDDEGGDDEEKPARTGRATSDGPTRIKLIKSASKPQKPGKVPKSRTSVPPPNVPGSHLMPTSAALAQLKPPPENAVAGSAEAPWGQLTGWELNRLRKRMKKNSNWTPSDTMIARELSTLKRGIDAFNLAKQKAEEEGRSFEGRMPVPIVDPISGEARMPLGALSVETLASDEKNLSNRGMKLNEAKKLKKEMLAKVAAEEAELGLQKTKLLAQAWITGSHSHINVVDQANMSTHSKPKLQQKKRKRGSAPEADAEKPELANGQAPKLQYKRTKTETPVPIPQLAVSTSQAVHETPSQPVVPRPVVHSTTPIPLPIHVQEQSITAKSGTSVASTTSPAPSVNAGSSTGQTAAMTNPTLAPIKLPAPETPVPPPVHSPKKITPIYPPARETRKTQAARIQEQQQETNATPMADKSTSRAASPAVVTPKVDSDGHSTALGPTANTGDGAPAATATEAVSHSTTVPRRPASRGKAGSQEPQPTLASERQRRASTARNTPAPDQRPPSRRSVKRPPPGTITRTVSGGKSAVGKRTAAPKKKKGPSAGTKSNKDKPPVADDIDVEIDDDGNEIDPDEPRYCICHGVSYGVMIQCDNADGTDGCKYEWFHLDCVGLPTIPARTTKWYCPDCRVMLKIGEKGEVSARGVKA